MLPTTYRGLATTAVLAFTFAVPSAGPAAAAPSAGQITMLRTQSPDFDNRCVGSSRAGRTYFQTCDPSSARQRWEWITAGRFFHMRNQGTGRCAADRDKQMVTEPCDTGNLKQRWSPKDTPHGVHILNKSTGRYLNYKGRAATIHTQGGSGSASPWQTPIVP
ncbi:RICIN domain-containing protein [Streptomyces tsukubensis]|uniref:Ricin B lectin domain-containing protein n=1 Tax=Streptomyces tsukubensis TaxID=83656 RepID=A0A1V4A637_9ACTN|nr:RICIN domain-containing protein [Streptomyces tsukubensis]OON76180.1 hypothetical protein B1H18_21385 [Streptomyces tsukubensis]